MAPTVLRKAGFRFFFFSREEPRMHVHAKPFGHEVKFWLEPIVALVQSVALNEQQLKQAHNLIEENQHVIRSAGSSISEAEVTHISGNGVWLLLAQGDRNDIA